MEAKPGKARVSLDSLIEYTRQFGEGLVATDGVAYSAAIAYGTVATNVIDELIGVGVTAKFKSMTVGLTQKFTGANGSLAGSLTYYLQARSEYKDSSAGIPTMRTGSWVPMSGTYQKVVGTAVTTEDTLSGRIGSLSHLPARVRLVAFAHSYPSGNCAIKNSSYIKVVGEVIPGA